MQQLRRYISTIYTPGPATNFQQAYILKELRASDIDAGD